MDTPVEIRGVLTGRAGPRFPHAKLKAAGVPGLSELLRGRFCLHFFFEDPAGYAIEIQRFHNPDIAKLF